VAEAGADGLGRDDRCARRSQSEVEIVVKFAVWAAGGDSPSGPFGVGLREVYCRDTARVAAMGRFARYRLRFTGDSEASDLVHCLARLVAA
jgi:hypothetical protein